MLTIHRGMFLWVRLVLCTLENVHSVQQLYDAVGELPKGLEKMYSQLGYMYVTFADRYSDTIEYSTIFVCKWMRKTAKRQHVSWHG
jgi:hypothetical protein